ncbi:MAG: hypothetical protein J2P36_34430 [Ktedonobacteraceae bacterium]|nr:hypothetical protein [Ktedonobacteraceae bacterium]
MSGQACCHDLVQQGRCYHQELAALQREEFTLATHHQVPETQHFTNISPKKREKVTGARRDHRERIAAC